MDERKGSIATRPPESSPMLAERDWAESRTGGLQSLMASDQLRGDRTAPMDCTGR